MHARDERADRIDCPQPALRGPLVDGRRDTVSRKDEQRSCRCFVLAVDEHGAPLLEVAHDVSVVDDLAPDVDGRTV
jgi:hypothetical protein